MRWSAGDRSNIEDMRGSSGGGMIPLGIGGAIVVAQADCYAGVWGHDAAQQGRAAKGEVELDPGDADEALHAAAAIGDDRLQKLGTGHMMPETFTHGTSEQRVTWFKRGFDSGDPRACETFAGGRE